ncbi:dUTP diphosphatase [Ornithinibacillus sp. 4-3]|uniref:dUTP diphosphatase n=1 Tax=Ornithinibacillus sp. 4-3 TaxID=3231488 RepID=A0AB39HRW4_9BACI
MNLQKLFETQAELDAHIIEEKGLQGHDLLDKKILALQVELGELANELPEEFKFWANKKNNYEKALKEYVDGLHFILSIGNDVTINKYEYVELIDLTNDITAQFNEIFKLIGNWEKEYLLMNNELYFDVVNEFLHLGKMLGFTWEEIEQAYYAKNDINHKRQEQGY